MTLEEIHNRVESILTNYAGPKRGFGPSLHEEEDSLFEDILQAIADGTCENPQACAKEALQLVLIRFDRWYE